jgi:hypothetical protein
MTTYAVENGAVQVIFTVTATFGYCFDISLNGLRNTMGTLIKWGSYQISFIYHAWCITDEAHIVVIRPGNRWRS